MIRKANNSVQFQRLLREKDARDENFPRTENKISNMFQLPVKGISLQLLRQTFIKNLNCNRRNVLLSPYLLHAKYLFIFPTSYLVVKALTKRHKTVNQKKKTLKQSKSKRNGFAPQTVSMSQYKSICIMLIYPRQICLHMDRNRYFCKCMYAGVEANIEYA